MNKKEDKVEKKINELDLLEQEFSKKIFGKFVRAITIITSILMLIGSIVIPIIEAIIYAKNLDIVRYQTIINFGEICFECAGKSLFFLMLFYVGILPALIKENKKENSKSSKFNLIIIIFTLCIVGPLLKLVYEICNLIL